MGQSTEWGLKTAFVCLLIVLTLDCGCSQTGYFPLTTAYSRIEEKDLRSSRFPDANGVPGGNCGSSGDARNLAGPIQFLNLSSLPSVLIGGAGALYLLDEDTLRCHDKYEEPSNQTLVNQCRNAMDDHSGCFNFLSVYSRFPSSDIHENRMLVCATNAGIYQDCTTIKIEDRMFNMSTRTPKVLAPFGLVSFFPQLGGFGEFRQLDGSVSDTTFFSAGFYRLPDVNRDIGRNYNITFQNVSFDEAASQLSLQRRLSIKDDQNWWNFPVEFTQYFKVSYPSQSQPADRNLDFYYIFLREGVVGSTSNMKLSRVMRICQNDPGVGDVFSTMLKAGIYCQREAPQDLQYVGSVDYRYNEINAVDLSAPGGGRYMERTGWSDYMYAAFSGPQLGPPGTAICVYHNNVINDPTQYNQGLYSVFLEDVIRAPGLNPPMIQNDYFACRPEGRPAEYINDVTININLAQIGEDPLIVLDGILVVKMLVDQVCVVRNDNLRSCRNQDIFFFGTDLGRVMKIVLASVGTRNYETVVAEDFVIDDGSYVVDMSFRSVRDVKKLFVSTNTSLHSFPLERCSRLQGCRECIGARDPYCVWNNNTGFCESAVGNGLTLSGVGETPVPVHIWQNIHTGMYPDCERAESCSVRAIATNATTVRCIAGCNFTSSSINISVNSPTKSSSTCSESFGSDYDLSGCIEFVLANGLGLHTYSCIVQSQYTFDVTTPHGLPAEFDSDVYASCGQSSCRVCVQELDLTDDITFYRIQLEYNATGGADITTPMQPFQQSSGCDSLTGLTPGSTISYRVSISNSVGSTSSARRSVTLLDGEAGPVQNLNVVLITSTDIQVTWQEPAVLNGSLLGYSMLVNGAPELICASRTIVTDYTVRNLLPYTNYTIEIRACNNHGESSQFMGISRQTECGVPSVITDASVNRVGTSLSFSWNAPQKYNGDILQEQYQITLDCYRVGQNGTTSIVTNSPRSILLADHISLANSPKSLCCASISAITMCNNSTMLGIPHVLCERTDDITPGAVVNLNVSDDSIGINSFVVNWQRPSNYDSLGLNYGIVVSGRPEVHTAEQFLFLSDLQPCTEYSVTVTAINSVSDSNGTSLLVTTKPALPSSPVNLRFSYDISSGALSLSWDMPSMLCSAQRITNYKVIWSCDGFPNQTFQSASNTNIVLSNNVNFGFCVAATQSCDSFDRCSAFSEQVVVEATMQPPPKLECYSYAELSNDIKVAFLFPTPFITSQLQLRWNLINNNSNTSVSRIYDYNASSTNILDLLTESNAQYVFHIFACNVYGCGNPCSLNFSTSAIPSPPSNINVSEIRSTSAVLSWVHSNTRPVDFSYAVSITSSCSDIDSRYIDNIQSTSYSIQGLCPNDNYSVVVLAEDRQVDQRSTFSNPILFRTIPGILSAPRLIVLSRSESKGVYITWHTPRYLNAQINGYVVKWVEQVSCDSDSKNEAMVLKDVLQFEFMDFQGDINKITACVRAISSNGALGQWGTNVKLTTQGLTSTAERNCNTLIIIACIAGLAVLASIIMVILLSCSLCQCYKYSSNVNPKN